ncbi:MAG: porin family protein [Bacteroidota bacterium]
MHKLLFSLLLLSCFTAVKGQTFQASVLAGFNMSQIDGDELSGFNSLGFNGGLRVLAVLSDRWRVGPELLFSQQGSRRGVNEFTSDFERVSLNTVEVPLMVYFKDWRFTAEAGLAYQRLINYTIEDPGGADISEDFQFRDNLLNIQFGVTLYLRPNLGINFRWSEHLTDIEANDGNLTLTGRKISIRAVYVLGGGETLPDPVEAE